MFKSLKLRLLSRLMLSLVFAWAATIAIAYTLTERTLNRQQDLQLERIASSLSQVVTNSETHVQIREVPGAEGGTSGGVEYQIWHNEKIVSYSMNAPKEELSPVEGFSQSDIGNKKWRVFSAQNPYYRVVVGEDLDVRSSLVRGLILSNLSPMLIALPVIALVIWLAVSLGLRPLSVLAGAIKSRSPDQLTRIDLGDVPSEIAPVIQSLNTLFEVVDRTFAREREFTDNAAHELRTPLSAIKAQAQVALSSSNDQERYENLLAVNQGVNRASKMIDQLLTLARLDPVSARRTFSKTDLTSLAARVIAKYTPQALAKQIDLGLADRESVAIDGDATSLELLISNLVDNAIRYSPVQSRIDVHLRQTDSAAILVVEDYGPGIPEAAREKVFERFFRLSGGETEGSGIGLAIVKEIVALHHAQIELTTPSGHSGLIARVIFPRAHRTDSSVPSGSRSP